MVVNTGSMTGSGTLQLGELDDITDYDNGIEYVELGLDWSDRTPASYDRYQFVRDPAATVEVVYFIGALSNQDGAPAASPSRSDGSGRTLSKTGKTASPAFDAPGRRFYPDKGGPGHPISSCMAARFLL